MIELHNDLLLTVKRLMPEKVSKKMISGSLKNIMKHLAGSSVKPDEEWMKQVSLGSPEESRVAFEVLYTRWKKPIMSYLYQVVQDSKTAEDLLQETFLKVFRSRAYYEPTAKFSTWLWTIAKNTAYDSLRKKTELLGTEEDGALNPLADEVGANPEDQLDQAWLEYVSAKKMRDCLEALTPRARAIVELRIFSEEDYEAISKITSESLGNVKTLLFRSKEALKKCFGGVK